MSYVFGHHIDRVTDDHPYFANSYWNCFMRMDVYFLGFLFGILLRNLKDSQDIKPVQLTRVYLLTGWVTSSFLLLGALYGPYRYYHHDVPQAKGQHN